jgi:hypothetical protein
MSRLSVSQRAPTMSAGLDQVEAARSILTNLSLTLEVAAAHLDS